MDSINFDQIVKEVKEQRFDKLLKESGLKKKRTNHSPKTSELPDYANEFKSQVYTRKKKVNNFKNKKVKVIKVELPKGNALY
jgi:hypothetical protein